MIVPRIEKGFFDEIKEIYPEEVEHFLKWIDQYKADHNWNKLFNITGFMAGVKYHELPFAMQLGIIAQYLIEQEDSEGKTTQEVFARLKNQIKTSFKELHNEKIHRESGADPDND